MPRPPFFADLDAALGSLDPKLRLKAPVGPARRLVLAARRLFRAVEPRRERFATLADFDLSAIDCLPELADRAEDAEFAFVMAGLILAKGVLEGPRQEAIAVRRALVAAARRALGEDCELLLSFEGFERRVSLAVLVADLIRLSELAEEHAQAFAAKGRLQEGVAQAARLLPEALLRSPRDQRRLAARDERNAVFALLGMAVKEVRAGGCYLFRNEPRLLRCFRERRLEDGRRKAPRGLEARLGQKAKASQKAKTSRKRRAAA